MTHMTRMTHSRAAGIVGPCPLVPIESPPSLPSMACCCTFSRGQTDIVVVVILVPRRRRRRGSRTRARRIEISCKSPSAAKIHRELIVDRSAPLARSPAASAATEAEAKVTTGIAMAEEEEEGEEEEASRERRLQYWRLFSSSSSYTHSLTRIILPPLKQT